MDVSAADFKWGGAPVEAACGLTCLLRFLTNNYELSGQSIKSAYEIISHTLEGSDARTFAFFERLACI